MRCLVTCLLMVVAGAFQCRSQAADQALAGPSDLPPLVAEEARRGIYLFYTQSFVDQENQRASYRGSLYGAIQKFELKGCELAIEALIVDKFAGTVGKRATGDMQDTFRYSARLMLTPDIVAGLALIEARPAQLGRRTHSVCDDNSSRSFPWLRFQAKEKVIREISTVNDAQNFQGPVDHFVVPVSSRDFAKRMIAELRSISNSRCR